MFRFTNNPDRCRSEGYIELLSNRFHQGQIRGRFFTLRSHHKCWHQELRGERVRFDFHRTLLIVSKIGRRTDKLLVFVMQLPMAEVMGKCKPFLSRRRDIVSDPYKSCTSSFSNKTSLTAMKPSVHNQHSAIHRNRF